MKMIDTINRANEILKEKEGKVVTVRGCNYLVEDGCVIENYKHEHLKKKIDLSKLSKGQVEEFLEFLED